MAPDQPVSRPHGSGSASRPASPFPIGWSPSLTGPDRPVARPHCSGSSGCPDSPAPRAARRCQAPAANSGFPAFTSPRGKPPGWCPFPAVKTFLRPSPASRKRSSRFILGFFPIHTLSTEFRRLSACHSGYPPPYAQLLHRLPDVTQRIPAMTAIVITPSFPDDPPLIPNSRPRPSPSTQPSPSSASPPPGSAPPSASVTLAPRTPPPLPAMPRSIRRPRQPHPQLALAGRLVPKTGLRPRRHHQHHDPGAPGQLERHETRFQCVLAH